MYTLLEYTDYIKFKRYIKESLDEHMFDEDPGVDFDEHWVKSESGSPEFQYISDFLFIKETDHLLLTVCSMPVTIILHISMVVRMVLEIGKTIQTG